MRNRQLQSISISLFRKSGAAFEFGNFSSIVPLLFRPPMKLSSFKVFSLIIGISVVFEFFGFAEEFQYKALDAKRHGGCRHNPVGR